MTHDEMMEERRGLLHYLNYTKPIRTIFLVLSSTFVLLVLVYPWSTFVFQSSVFYLIRK